MGYDICIRNLQVVFNKSCIINFNDFDFKNNTIYVIKGPNGSGKTTLLKLIQNIYPAKNGIITINGLKNSSKTLQNHICSFFDKENLFDFLTPQEYILLIASNYGIKKSIVDERIKTYQNTFLKHWSTEKKLIRDYSDGNKQLLGICTSLIVEPKLLLLDEPFNYLDEKTKKILGEFLQIWQNNTHSTVIMSSNMEVSNYISNFETVNI